MADWNPRANSLFLNARELAPGAHRDAYLDDECGADWQLKAEVQALLDADGRAANFLESVEQEYSRIRGRWSPLGPLDWQLAAKWETDGVPLSVVIRAMETVHKKFQDSRRKDSINSLRYFEKQVDVEFGEWLSRQVGKSGDYLIGVDPGSISLTVM